MPARRRRISPPEIQRRQRQRDTPPPAYCALNDMPGDVRAAAVVEPMSAGACSELLNAQPPPRRKKKPKTEQELAEAREGVPRPSGRQRHPRPPPTPLLVARKDAALMLGAISVATLIRLEQRGVLHPVRLNRQARTGQVFYRHDDLVRLAHAS